jgi:hypothetical protein
VLNTSNRFEVKLCFNVFYAICSIVRQIKSRRMGWEEQVARMGQERKVYRVLAGKAERKRTTWKTKA